MALTVTLSNMRAQVRQRADIENSNVCTNSEIDTHINSAIRDLYDMLVQADEDYYTISSTIAATGLTATYSLPTNFYKLKGVDYPVNGIQAPMEKYSFMDRNKYIYNDVILRYRIVGSNIVFTPIPAAQTITLWYVPAPADLAADSDTFDGINGWEDFVVVDAAIKCVIKQEQDPSPLMAEKNDLVSRINAMKEARDIGQPEVMTDVRNAIAFPWVFPYGR